MSTEKLYTSSFIGISVIPDLFIPLYVDIQNYFRDQNIDRPIVMSNILSLHLTLYYLNVDPANNVLTAIKKILFGKKIDFISINDLEYFFSDNNKKTAYLSVKQLPLLREINDEIKERFGDGGVGDNKYDFVPHITLFNVLDNLGFQKIEVDIDRIIIGHIDRLQNKNVFKGTSFYRVNSKYSPEIQIPGAW